MARPPDSILLEFVLLSLALVALVTAVSIAQFTWDAAQAKNPPCPAVCEVLP